MTRQPSRRIAADPGGTAEPGRASIEFAAFFMRWSGRTRGAFLAAVRVPHLVMPLVEVASEPELADRVTEKVDPERAIAHWDLQLLLAVRGRRKGDRRVTLGRSSENDLVLVDGRLSKHQAWFERTRDGEWLIGDAGSTNGTRVDAVAVPRTHGVRVRSGARIRLAESVDVVFLEPEALWGVLERVRAAHGRVDPV